MSNTMWGGRFAGSPAEAMEEINASIEFDRKLAAQDIAGSEAHLAMLARQGIIEAADAQAIAKGLAQVKGEIEAGTFSFSRALEDIHMNVESRLSEIVGAAAGRLHTARSRNDQVAVDFRMWVRDAIDAIRLQIARLQRALAARALELGRHGHAGLHPSAIGAAGHLRPSSHGLCRDAGARCGPLRRRAQAPQRMPARRRRACRHLVPDRPRHDREGARLRPADRELARQRRRSRLRPRGARRRGDRGDPSFAPRRGDRALDDAAIRLRQALRRLHDRLVDHAAEAQSRRGRAGARQDRADRRRSGRASDRDEGPAARLFEGHAGRQGRRLRRVPHPRALARRHHRHGRGHDARAQADESGGRRWLTRPRPTSPTGSCGRSSCHSAKPTTSPAASSPSPPRAASRWRS